MRVLHHPHTSARARAEAEVRTRTPDWGAAGTAGIAGALLFLVLEVGPLFFGGEPLRPLRMIAAIAFTAWPNPDPSNAAVLVAALAIHLPLSLLYGRAVALLTYRRTTTAAVLTGALFGLVIYLVNFYAFTMAFPWFAEVRSLRTVLDHALFGAAVAWVYKRLEGRVDPS